MLRTVLVALLLLGCAAPTSPTPVNWGAKSALLEEGLTEAQVIEAVGYRPSLVNLETCGVYTRDGGWQCKGYRYGSLEDGLTVLFRKDGANWVVNAWYINP